MNRPFRLPSIDRRSLRLRLRSGGFTMIEILVVVIVIGILTSLLLIGVSYLKTNAKRQQTRLALTKCQAMFGDYDAATRAKYGTSVDPSPGDVTGVDRYGTAVLLTRDVMNALKAFPNNAAALGKTSAGELMTIPSGYTLGAGSTWASGTPYKLADRASITVNGSPVVYTCVQANTATSTSPSNGPPNPNFWIPATDSTAVPILLDGWGNPIIFVPGGTLGNATAGIGAVYSGSGTSAIAAPAKSPDGRPFFASAGPDGDFSKGDDNLYSYE